MRLIPIAGESSAQWLARIYTIEKLFLEIERYKNMRIDFDMHRITPSKIVGTGLKDPRKAADEYLTRCLNDAREAYMIRMKRAGKRYVRHAFKFYPARRYLGIVYNKLNIHVGIDNARESGIREAFTRHGKPHSRTDACEWIELPNDNVLAAAVWLYTVGDRKYRKTSKVVEVREHEWLYLIFSEGYDLITC